MENISNTQADIGADKAEQYSLATILGILDGISQRGYALPQAHESSLAFSG